jgi:predicted nucleotidyltransferase
MSIASALFSESQSRLFRWLFGQSERSFHMSELRRLTSLGSASLQRELRKLTEAGLVSSERVGNLRLFQANSKSPVFSELVTLTRKTLGIEPMLREALLSLSPKLRAAWIYGSVAKQTETATSDIDVMLVGENLVLGEVLERLLPLEEGLGRKINPTCYSSAEFERRLAEPDSFVNRVMAQPLLPLIGDTNEFTGAR